VFSGLGDVSLNLLDPSFQKNSLLPKKPLQRPHYFRFSPVVLRRRPG